MPVDVATLLEGLNPEQRDAVTHQSGPLLVVAGAGSGKTRVLTRRIAWLIAEARVSPFEILAITFTNKAADEMKHRVADLVGPVAQKMWVSTFHSACVRILRRDADRLGFSSRFTIYDQADAVRLAGYVARDLDLDPKKLPPRSLHAAISAMKNDGVDVATAESQVRTIYDRKVADVYREYQQRLKAANALDFDDLLLRTVELFKRAPDVLEGYQRRFKHLLVDEYQDTNKVQNELVLLLGAHHANVCVVGDHDQSVYRFRGADIRNIAEFEHAFPDTTVITLAQNYRSTQTILDAANAVIDHNAGRKPKHLWSDRGRGDKVIRFTADDEHDEAAWVASEIHRLHTEEHERWGDIAVFFRANSQSRALEEALANRRVPYKVIGGTRFYDRKEVKDVLAYLRAVVNEHDEVSLKRIANTPRRGVGDTSVAKVDAFAVAQGISFGAAVERAEEAGVSGKALTGLRSLRILLTELREMAEGRAARRVEVVDTETGELGLSFPGEAGTDEEDVPPLGPGPLLEEVLQRTGYLAELEADKSIEAEGRMENLAELIGQAAQFEDVASFLEATSLIADSDQIDDDESQVVLMTLHTAKGLEYDVAFLVGLEDGVFPHVRTLGEPDELEEERRLAYVGITRARHRLYLTNAWSRSLWGTTQYNPLSRFVREIPPALMAVAAGSRNQGRDGGEERVRVWGSGNGSGTGAALRDRIVETALRRGRGATPTRGSGAAALGLRAGDDVVHAKWGEGVVISVDEGRGEAVVRFPGMADKVLDLTLAPLKRA